MDKILATEMKSKDEKNNILLNEQFLSLDYIPHNVLFREEKIKQLFNFYRPIFTVTDDNYSFTPSIVILGKPGTGKSLTIRRFGIELQNLVEQKRPSYIYEFRYINCRRNRTVFSVLVNLMKSFLPDFPNRGFSSSEILRMFQDMLNQTQTHLLIALDEINYLINDPDFQNFLYSLTRVNDESIMNVDQKISLILIAQDKLFLDYVDTAVKSSLYKNIIYFEKYSKDELYFILKERSELALKHGSISESILEKIANLTQEQGNARFTIEFLWRTAKKTQTSNLSTITEKILLDSFKEIIPFSREIIKDLSFQQKIFLLSIIQCFERNPEVQFITLNQIKSEFQLECQELELKVGTGNTSLWNHLQVLKKLEIIGIDVVSKNYRGRFSKIFLKSPKEVLKDELNTYLNINLKETIS